MSREYIEELKKIIYSKELTAEKKKQEILQYHESDIADCLEELSKEERLSLYKILGNDNMSQIFSYLDDVKKFVDELSNEDAADIIELMDSDDAIDVLEELDEEDRRDIVSLMEEESVKDIKLIRKYSDDQIGSQMTNNYILISKNNNVKSAMKQVIALAAENDNVSTIYIEDEDKKFYGAIELRELIIARENDNFESIIKKNYPSFKATELISDCINDLKEYSLDSYPILDKNDQMIGVITLDDVVWATDDQLSDDYAKLGGLTEEENLNESVFASVKKRLPWLIILLFLGLFVSSIISGFESVVAALPMIVFFQSMVLDMAGNVGTQSLAVTVRLLSDKEVKTKDLIKTCLKEIRIGFLNGLILAILALIFVYLFLFITKQTVTSDAFNSLEALKASGIVAFSLLLSMTLCSLIGSAIPIVFMKLKIDPAVASGPFITTINDVIAVVIYYGLAAILFLNL